MSISLSNNNPAILPEDTTQTGASPSITLTDTNGNDYSLTADGDALAIVGSASPTLVTMGGNANVGVLRAGGNASLYLDGGTNGDVYIRSNTGAVANIDCKAESIVVNEGGADMDFRVEGDTNTSLIHADASADRVGINVADPDAKLEVIGASSDSSTYALRVRKADDTKILAARCNGSVEVDSLFVENTSGGILFNNTTNGSQIGLNSSDTNDNGVLQIGSGSEASNTRGAYLNLYGNEHGSHPGDINLFAGNVSGGDIRLFTANTAERVSVGYDGHVAVRGDHFRIDTAKTPASASDTGTTGQIAWDSSYIYVCTAANTWKRAALATW